MDQIGPDPWATFIPILSMSDPNLIHCWQLGAARKGGREVVLIRELKRFPAGTLQAARRQTSSVMVRGGGQAAAAGFCGQHWHWAQRGG